MKQFKISSNFNIFFIILFTLLMISDPGYSQDRSFNQRITLAQNLVRQGQNEQALKIYRDLFEQHQDHDALYALYKQALDRTLKFDEWLTVIDKRLLTKKNDLQLMSDRFYVLYKSGKELEARASWDDMINRMPNNEAVYRFISAQHQRMRLYDDAIATMLKGRENLNDSGLFANQLANLYYSRRNYKKATEEYLNWIKADKRMLSVVERMINSFPADSEVVADVTEQLENFSTDSSTHVYVKRLLAGFHIKNKEYDKAYESHIILDTETKTTPQNLLSYSQQMLNMGKYEYSLKGFQNIVENTETGYEPTALFGWARSLEEIEAQSYIGSEITDSLKQNGIELAFDKYNEVINRFRKGNEVIHSYLRIGNIKNDYYSDPDGAIESYAKVIQMDPTSPYGHEASIKTGDCYLKKGDIEQANNSYRSVTQIHPETLDIELFGEYKLLMSDYMTGKIDGLKAGFDSLFVRTPKNKDLSNDIINMIMFLEDNAGSDTALKNFGNAELLIHQGKSVEAENLLLSILENSSDMPLADDVFNRVGEIRLGRGLYTESINTYKELIEKYPESPFNEPAHLKIGTILEKNLKDTQGAIKQYEEFLIKYGNSIHVDEVRLKLRNLQK